MTTTVTYKILAQDMMSSPLARISQRGTSTFSKLDYQQDRFQAELNQSSRKTRTLRSNIDRLGTSNAFSRLRSQLMAGFGVFMLIRGATDSLNKFNTQAQAEAQVMQGVASTNQAAGRTFEQLTAAATGLQQNSLFGDESILQGVTAQILTFTNITGNAFDRTQQAALDVTSRLYGSEASAESLRSTSIMLGKALNDPVANLGALSRSGIQFAEDQKVLIKSLYESGRVSEAQSIILDELERQYGGSAKAAAKAGTGGVKQWQNAVGDTQEKLGSFLAVLQQAFLPALWRLNEVFGQIVASLQSTWEWYQRNSAVINTILSALLAMLAAYSAIMVATKVWTAYQWLLNAALTANPIGVIIMAIAALIGAIVYAWNKFEGFRKVVFGLWGAFKSVFTNIRDLAKNVMGGLGELIMGALTFDMDRIKSGLSKLGQSFSQYGKSVADAYRENAQKGIRSEDEQGEESLTQQGLNALGVTGLGGNTGGGTGTQSGGGIDGQIDGVISGGKQVRNYNITIDRQIENFTISTTNIQDGIEGLRDKIREALLTAVNDVNLAAK